MAVTWKKLAYEENHPLLTLFAAAHTVLYSEEANVALGLAVAANGIVGRLAAANIASLTPANVREIINVEDGADVTDATNVEAAGAIMESDIVATGDLIVGANAGNAAILPIGANGQVLKVVALEPAWAEDIGAVAFPETANATTMAAIDPVLGKGCFRVDELAPYVCTVIT